MAPPSTTHRMRWPSAVRLRLPWLGGLLLLLVVLPLTVSRAGAQQAAGDPGSDDELAAQATDPTAALMSLQFNDWYTASFYDQDGSANQVVFRPVIPFRLLGTQHIFRATLPYFTSSPSGSLGLGDITVFDLVVFDQAWGRWGVGVSGTLPSGGDGLTLAAATRAACGYPGS